MSSLIPLTQISAGSSTGVTGNAQALSGGPSALFGAAGMGANFWDMIIAQFGQGDTANDGTTIALGENNVGNEKTPAKIPGSQTSNPLAMLQVALARQTVDAEGNIVLTPNADGTTIQSELDFTNNVINFVKTMLPEGDDANGKVGTILTKLQAKSDSLEASLSMLENPVITKDTPVEDIPLPVFIALGLDPAQISQVTEKLHALQDKLGREITVEDLIAGVGNILPPAPQKATLAFASAQDNTIVREGSKIETDGPTPTDDLAAMLNLIAVGGTAEIPQDATANFALAAAVSTKEKPLNAPAEILDTDQTMDASLALTAKPAKTSPIGASSLEDTAEPALSDDTTSLDAATVAKDGDKAETPIHGKKDAATIKENFATLLNTAKAQQGNMTFPVAATGIDADPALYNTATPALQSASVSFGSTAQAANIITSSASAGQPHPAAQYVAATLSKAGKDGADQIMTIRLDPPELGNVSIRLQFGKDKTAKAVISVEKPETYMMLQRDSHILERALHSAGYETKNDALSFQLHDQGNGFGHDNKGEGGDTKSGGRDGGTQAIGSDDILQSSVTWQVDPSTGHVRYNIFA